MFLRHSAGMVQSLHLEKEICCVLMELIPIPSDCEDGTYWSPFGYDTHLPCVCLWKSNQDSGENSSIAQLIEMKIELKQT